MIEPALKKLEQEYHGQVDVWKVNADEQPELLRKLRIFGIPTVVAFRDGQEVARKVGAASPDALNGLFQAGLGKAVPAKPSRMSPADRMVRIFAGIFLMALASSGAYHGWYLLLAIAGAAVAFSAFYDRCPVWQAIAPRLSALVRGKGQDNGQSA
jgi:thioredoxin 1